MKNKELKSPLTSQNNSNQKCLQSLYSGDIQCEPTDLCNGQISLTTTLTFHNSEKRLPVLRKKGKKIKIKHAS